MKDPQHHESVFIIVPCYNEKTVIRQTLLGIINTGFSIVVVDDGSTEDIYAEVQDLSVYYLRHIINLGQGAALQTGMDFAVQHGAQAVVHFDADGQHDPKEISTVLHPILNQECDVVIGSRFMKNSKAENIPFSRKIILQLGRVFNKIFTGFWLTDAHNGFRALSINALKKIKLQENRMAHATEILQQIKKEKLTLKEVPVHIIYSEYSIAKGQSPWNAINILIDMTIRKLL